MQNGGLKEGAGYGARLKAMRPLVDFGMAHLVDKAEIINGEAALPDPGRPLVIIASHGPLSGVIPMMLVMGRFFLDHGLDDLVAGIYPHKMAYWGPVGRRIFAEYLGTPTRVRTVDELADLLKTGKIHMTGTSPEGLNCNLSWDEYVAPLRSGGMVAVAIKAGAALCLIANLGAEPWNLRLDLPFGLKVPLTRGLRGVNVPLPPVTKIKRFLVNCQRYVPSVDAKDLENMSPSQRRMALSLELESIRARLILMTETLKQRMAQAG